MSTAEYHRTCRNDLLFVAGMTYIAAMATAAFAAVTTGWLMIVAVGLAAMATLLARESWWEHRRATKP